MAVTAFGEFQDPFIMWCKSMGVLPANEKDLAKMFELYIYETTGWDGRRDDE